jgi:ADP-ribose pyrophosphatase YjhB (NUDIX family)
MMQTFVTVDVIIEVDGGIPLVRRGSSPFRGSWAIPGGFVEDDETVEEAAAREAKEETDLDIHSMEILGVYSKPGRDPRGRSITVAFVAKSSGAGPIAGSDAAEVSIFDPEDLPGDLAFDHGEILRDYLSLRRSRVGNRGD